MAIQSCRVLVLEGTNSSGKTTLAHALVARYKFLGVNAACTEEPARSSPLIEAIVLHGEGDFDLETELDLFGAQLVTCIRAARYRELLIVDTSLLNVVAYAEMLLPERDQPVVHAMAGLCSAVVRDMYDAVYFIGDEYDSNATNDRLRGKVGIHQQAFGVRLSTTVAAAGVDLIRVPTGLSTTQQVDWITQRELSKTPSMSAV